MRIRTLKLERFRGARNLSLDLDERLNLFVGMNGAGKSSILEATAILLSWMANRIKHPGASGRPITEEDISNGQSSGNLEISVTARDQEIAWNISRVRKGYSRKDAISGLSSMTEWTRRINEEITEKKGRVNLPLLAYYPVNRVVLDIPLRIKSRHSFDLLAAYDESLTSGANFRTFFEWFREREDLENEARRDQMPILPDVSAAAFPDPQLEAVRRALTSFMPDFSHLTVRRNPLRMEVEKRGERLTVNQLSDGEKCLMALVGDLARRLAIANPERENPLEGEGIVLVDEIDLHLHPLWQRMVVPNLLSVFTNCQFLITTHSPHVITHVKPASLFLLSMTEKGLKMERASASYGLTVERILADLMGVENTRPAEVVEKLREMYRLIERGDLDDAKKAITRLESEMVGDSELVRAGVLIKRKELIGK
jgi:predicted ATP-binding protein involved in virulence